MVPLPPVFEGVFTLAAQHSNKCLEVSHGLAQTFTCDSDVFGQFFGIIEIGRDVYRLSNADTLKCLQVPGGSLGQSVQLTEGPCGGAPGAQAFRIQGAAGGYVEIVNVNSGGCVDVRNSNALDGAPVQQFPCNGTAAQRWLLARTFFSGPLQIRASHSGKCLEAPMGAIEGSLLVQHRCNRSVAGQLFRVDALGAGRFTLINLAGGTCLDVPTSQTSAGVRLQMFRCNGTSAQWFRIEGVGGGHDRIVNVNSGKCVAVVDSSEGEGASIEQVGCDGSDDQTWALVVP